MSIYNKTKMMCRTWIEAINNLFNMGKDLETEVDGLKGGIVKDVTLTEVDKHYTLTILYDDDTSDTVTWDDSTVGIEDITMTYQDGVYILTITLTDGTRYTFSIPVGNVVTEEELQDAVDTINTSITAMNVGSPDDTASSTGSLWARVKNAVSRIVTLETADTQNVKLNGNQTINNIKTFSSSPIVPNTPAGNTSAVNKSYVDNKRVESNSINSTQLKSFIQNANPGDQLFGLRIVYTYLDEQEQEHVITLNEISLSAYASSTTGVSFVGSGGITTTPNVNTDNNILLRMDYSKTNDTFALVYLDLQTQGLKYELTGISFDTTRFSLSQIDIIKFS